MPSQIPVFRKHDRYKASSYRVYNAMGATYDTSFWMKFYQRGVSLADRAIIEALGPEIASLAILDVGCATGRLLLKLAQTGARCLSGVDLAPNVLEAAKGKLASRNFHAELRVADSEDSLPWPAESFDVLTLTGVLHHFYRPVEALSEMRRVLRPEGRILVWDPCWFPLLRWALNVCLRIAPHAGDCRFYSQEAAARLLEDAGFRPVRVRRVSLWFYGITAIKAGAPAGVPQELAPALRQ